MVKEADKIFVPESGTGLDLPAPTRWIAESQGEQVGGVELTPRGKYRATNRSGRRVGTFDSLSEARECLETAPTRRQRMNQSTTLQIVGLVAFCTAAIAAAIGIFFLFLR